MLLRLKFGMSSSKMITFFFKNKDNSLTKVSA